MRIISGKYRGKKLKEFDLNSTRPTADRVKESIFNLIQFEVADAVVLDLFAGTGALGIEAISRGAKQAYFVDSNKQAIEIVNENLKTIEGDTKIMFTDAISALQKFKNENKKFDIVFIDPPYATDLGIKSVEYILTNDLLTSSGQIIFETAVKNEIEFNLKNCVMDKRKYGITNVFKIQKVKDEN